MRTTSFARLFLAAIVAAALSGCATAVPEVRTAETPNVRTITAIGDRPISVASGNPGSQETSIIPRALPDREPEREVAGRVLDPKGQPVPNAEVRVAIGNTTGGRDERVYTDELGRFTLHDLREGSDYSIVAEWPDGRGGYLSGRSRSSVPAREVEITLARPGATAEGIELGGPRRVGQVSQREELLDDEPMYSGRSPAGRINDEDLPLPDEAETLLSSQNGESIPPLTSAYDSESEIAWRRRDNAARAGAVRDDGPATFAGDPEPFDENNPLPPAREQPIGFQPPLSSRSAVPDNVGDSLRMKPVEPVGDMDLVGPGDGDPGSIPASDPASERLIEKTFAGSPEPDFPEIRSPKAAESPGTSSPPPDEIILTEPDEASSSADDVPAPDAFDEPVPAPLVEIIDEPAREPQAIERPALPPPDDGPDQTTQVDPAEEALGSGEQPPSFPLETGSGGEVGPEPTPPVPPSGLEAQNAESETLGPPSLEEAGPPPSALAEEPSDEPLTLNLKPPARKWSWSEMAQATSTATNQPIKAPTSMTAPGVSLTSAAAAAVGPPPLLAASEEAVATVVDTQVMPATCKFDRKGRRIVDFQMTDVNGKTFRFKDLDAEYILLDFWGTWCGPCVRSIPHLIDLQSRFGADKLKIVGVAYEEGGFQERATTVKSVARRLGINYDVLIGEADGEPCPLKYALNVQVFPTMVLLDRQGRILWRDQGATTATMGRLDRVIAVNLSGQTLRR